MNHIQLSIQAKEEQQEILISELSELDAIGFEQTVEILLAYFDENNFESKEVHKVLSDFVFHLTSIAKRNWNEVWESNFQPVIVDDFCSCRFS